MYLVHSKPLFKYVNLRGSLPSGWTTKYLTLTKPMKTCIGNFFSSIFLNFYKYNKLKTMKIEQSRLFYLLRLTFFLIILLSYHLIWQLRCKFSAWRKRIPNSSEIVTNCKCFRPTRSRAPFHDRTPRLGVSGWIDWRFSFLSQFVS